VAQRKDLRVPVPAAHRQQPQQREHVRHTEIGRSQHGPSPCHSVPRHTSAPPTTPARMRFSARAGPVDQVSARGSPDRAPVGQPQRGPSLPAGSHDTVTPPQPAATARPAAQSSTAPRSQARHRNTRRAMTLSSRDRSPRPSACCPPNRSRRSRSPPAPRRAAAPAGHYGYRHPRIRHYRLPMNVLPLRGTPSPQRTRGDVPTSRTNTQNAFLCRSVRGQRGRGRYTSERCSMATTVTWRWRSSIR
jgi:hypothetical protein